jgi:pimeloyl-ACP methyl ester carboxylesterase
MEEYPYIEYKKNFDEINEDMPFMLCLHGNSSSLETFLEILKLLTGVIQVVAIDLPGCGRSSHLESYNMSQLGQIIWNWTVNKFNPKKVYLFGHSLGGHLLAYIPIDANGYILAGTPPLSSVTDFPLAFAQNEETAELIPLLSKEEPFTYDEAYKFVSHTGVTGATLDLMVDLATKTDGKFRKGCLSSILDIDQKKQLKTKKNVIIFHAKDDGVIQPSYLETIEKTCLFEGKIHYLEGKHMSPLLQPDIIVATIKRAFDL